VRPSALRSGPLGDFVATHDMSVSPRNRQEVTKKSERAEPPTDAATRKLELIHMDRGEPLPASLGKAHHFVAVLDDATGLAMASALKSKREGGKAVQA